MSLLGPRAPRGRRGETGRTRPAGAGPDGLGDLWGHFRRRQQGPAGGAAQGRRTKCFPAETGLVSPALVPAGQEGPRPAVPARRSDGQLEQPVRSWHSWRLRDPPGRQGWVRSALKAGGAEGRAPSVRRAANQRAPRERPCPRAGSGAPQAPGPRSRVAAPDSALGRQPIGPR